MTDKYEPGPLPEPLIHSHQRDEFMRPIECRSWSALQLREYAKSEVERETAKLRARAEKAEASLRHAGYTDNGGDLWKPPLGQPATPLLRLIDELRAEIAELRKIAQAEADDVDNLRAALHEIAEEWAGAECGEPVYAQEAYAIHLAKRMGEMAAKARSGIPRPSDAELERLTGEPHIDGWPLESGLPIAESATSAPRETCLRSRDWFLEQQTEVRRRIDEEWPQWMKDGACVAVAALPVVGGEAVQRESADTMRQDAERYRWLRSTLHSAVGGGIEVNDQRLVYEEPEPGEAVRVYWYPVTPVGFHESKADTLDAAVDEAIAASRATIAP